MVSFCARGAAAIMLAAGVATAEPILSNLPGSSSGTGSNLGVGTDLVDRTKGVGLTMGAQNLQFVSMDVLISNTGADALLSGGIYASAAGNPGALLASFTGVNVASGTSAAIFSLSVAGGFDLLAGQSYWFVLDGPAVSNSLLWNSLSPNATPTASGVTFDGYRFSSNGGATWANSTIFNGMTINAVVPAPGVLAGLGLAGLVGARRRR
jgi:hypothetical protein